MYTMESVSGSRAVVFQLLAFASCKMQAVTNVRSVGTWRHFLIRSLIIRWLSSSSDMVQVQCFFPPLPPSPPPTSCSFSLLPWTKRWQNVVQEAIGSAQAFQEQTHIKVEAVDVKQEEGASNDIKFEVPTDGVGNTQPDDIFGPAHEFDWFWVIRPWFAATFHVWLCTGTWCHNEWMSLLVLEKQWAVPVCFCEWLTAVYCNPDLTPPIWALCTRDQFLDCNTASARSTWHATDKIQPKSLGCWYFIVVWKVCCKYASAHSLWSVLQHAPCNANVYTLNLHFAGSAQPVVSALRRWTRWQHFVVRIQSGSVIYS